MRGWNHKDFTSIGEVLESSLPGNARFKYAIKMSTLFGFWDKIVGRKFEKTSRPLTIKFSKLQVSCQNSYVVQELNMFKSDLIKKIAAYAEPLGLKVEDIIFSTKEWREPASLDETKEPAEQIFSKEELAAFSLSEDETKAIKENIEKLSFLTDSQKQKYYSDIADSLKAKKLRGKFVSD